MLMIENTTTNNAQELSKKEKKAIYDKQWNKLNREKIAAQKKFYCETNKEVIAAQKKSYYESNKEIILKRVKAYSKPYYQTHKEEIIKYAVEYKKERLKCDPLFAAKHKLRGAVTHSFKRIAKNKPTDTQTLLGCTWEEAKLHFESLFTEGMSWSNHGEWHIDHIRPVSSFKEEELHLMNHISNLQPLWAKDNIIKSNYY